MIVNLNTPDRNGVWLIEGTKISVVSTRNIINYLLQLTTSLDAGTRNLDPDFIRDFKHNNLKLIQLEHHGFRDSISINLRLRYWYDHYKDAGRTFYSHQKLGTHYTLVTRILNKKGYKAFVMLKPGHSNNTKKFTPIGVFSTMAEADEWMAAYYPSGPKVYTLVFAFNELTKKFINN